MTRLAITMGDPAGIGPEVCLQFLAKAPKVLPDDASVVIYGDRDILNRVAEVTGLPTPADSAVRHLSTGIKAAELVPGRVHAACGHAAFHYIETAIAAACNGQIDAVVTAPINKEALRAAGIDFPGHTEIFAARTDATRSCMMQYSTEVTATFVTCHCGYADVPDLISVDRILDVIEMSHAALLRIKGAAPKLVTLGLNPHAGEHGLFGGGEEEKIILPALEAARQKGIDVTGPIPPDTAFLPQMRQTTDCFICMYHDQGHIPLKALAFDSAVNVTLGLPIVRTSVDHGTAFDIAWQGKANPGSMIEACRLAMRLAEIEE